MATNELRFDVIGDASSAADAFTETATTADLAAKGARTLAIALETQRKAARSSVDATLSLAKADAILAEVEREESGAAQKERDSLLELAAAKDAASGSVDIAGIGSQLGAVSGQALPALIGSLVALAPVLVTAGLGLGVFGAAAYEDLKGSTQLAAGIKDLRGDFDLFAQSVKPEVMTGFNSALGIARGLMIGLAPVARSAGTALDSVLTGFGQQIQSGEFQQFFTWMAQNAGPDVQLLGRDLEQLTGALPPLLEDLNPAGQSLLVLAGNVVALTRDIAALTPVLSPLAAGFALTGHSAQLAAHEVQTFTDMFTGVSGILDLFRGPADTAKQKTDAMSGSLQTEAQKAQTVAQQITAIDTALSNLLDPTTANIGAQIQFANDQATLAAALKTSNGQIGLQNQNARDAASAMNQATTDALALSNSILTQTGSTQKAVAPLQALLGQLEGLHSKDPVVTKEIQALQGAIASLQSKKIMITVEGQLIGNQQAIALGAALGASGGGVSISQAVGILSHASGGVASGWSLVGEQGPELAYFGTPAQIFPADKTRAMVAGVGARPQARGGGGTVRLVVDGGGSQWGELMAEWIRNFVRITGGGDVQQALGY